MQIFLHVKAKSVLLQACMGSMKKRSYFQTAFDYANLEEDTLTTVWPFMALSLFFLN